MTEDECYLLVTGKIKAQYEESKRKRKEEYQRREEDYKEQISELCKAYEKDAEGRISEDDMDYFKEILPVRVGDLYHEMEIRCLFEIIDALNSGGLDAAMSKFDEQGHSGNVRWFSSITRQKISSWSWGEFLSKDLRNNALKMQ